MRKLAILILVIIVTVSAFAGVSSMASRLPRHAETVLVIEDLKENYDKMKTTTFLDFFLEQLAVEILIQQYFEMIVYNSGSRPSEIYPAVSADVGFASWYCVESRSMKNVIVLGPMDRASAARTALRRVLPQFIPAQDVPEIAVDGNYLFLGDVNEFAATEKGFPAEKLVEGLPKGFGYLFAATGDFVQRGSIRVEDSRIVIDGYVEGQTEEARSLVKMIPGEKPTVELEKMKHYSLVAAALSVNDPSAFEDYLGIGFDLLLQLPGTEGIQMEEALPLVTGVIGHATGRVMLDFNVPIEDIFSAILSLQIQGDADIDVPGYDYLTRYEFAGTLDDIKTLFEAAGVDYSETNGSLRTEDGQHIWLDEGWLFQSNSRRAITDERLQKSRNAFESANFRNLVQGIPEDRFFIMFADTGHFLAGLLGGSQIQSGLVAAAWYSQEKDLIEFRAILK